MVLRFAGRQIWRSLSIAALLAAGGVLNAPARADWFAQPSTKPIPAETLALLKRREVKAGAPIYIRIFKEESELEVLKARGDGRYVVVKVFPICNWSGGLGPKQSMGDHMAPEGFYALTKDSLKPDSSYHLALNIGYPNALDRTLARTGDFLMVHGKCQSVGCYALGDDNIEEVYAFAREAFAAGHEKIPLHIFPFRMNEGNMALHLGHPASESWAPLKEAYDDFTSSRQPPQIAMCSKRYVVNALWAAGQTEPLDAGAECPAYMRRPPAPMSKKLAKSLAGEPLRALGQKTRTAHDIAYWDEAAAKAAYAAIKKREDERKLRKLQESQRLTETGGIGPMLH